MRALVIEHDPVSDPERVGTHLERRGFSLEHFVVVEDVSDPSVTVRFPDDGYDLVVLMGSPWSVYQPEVQSWVRPELEFIRSGLDRDVPFLAICFGAQAMSAALGGSVRRSDRPEYGWVEVGSKVDQIAQGPWFQFHHDRFSLPSGAVELARNDAGIQAFRIGRSLAVQFHPEMTDRLLASWCEVDPSELIRAGIDPEGLIEESRQVAVETQPALETMMDWFLDYLVGSVGVETT